MGLHLEPIEIVAVVVASLAVFVVLVSIIYYFTHRSHRQLEASSFVLPTSAQPLNHSTSPSTTHTGLVTPSSSIGSKLKKSRNEYGLRGHTSPQEKDRDSDIIMVTYEEGLRRMGITRSVYPKSPSEQSTTRAVTGRTGVNNFDQEMGERSKSVDWARDAGEVRRYTRSHGVYGGEENFANSIILPSYYHRSTELPYTVDDARKAESQEWENDEYERIQSALRQRYGGKI